jgi:hypothetical protein
MSAEPIETQDELLTVGAICRSRNTIIKTGDPDASRLCKIIGTVRQVWWRRADTPEYKVKLLAFPIIAIRRASELQLVSQ